MSASLSSVPWPYLIAASFLAAASVANLLLRADEWWSRINPSGKIAFSHLLLSPSIDITDGIVRMKAIQIGAQVQSSASFPIYYRLDTLTTQFQGRVPLSKDYQVGIISEIPASGIGYFRDTVIPMDIEITNDMLQGEISFKIEFWKNEGRKFVYERKLKIFASHNQKQESIGFNWVDA